jgi:hypothetical protein
VNDRTNPLLLLVALLAATAVGCAGATPPVDGPPPPPHEHGAHAGHHGPGDPAGHEHAGHRHPEMKGAVHAFHEVLGPLWHAPKGPDREAKTCDAAPTFEARAADVVKERPEGGDAAARAAALELVAAVSALKAECAKPAGGRADFEAKLTGLHGAFHGVVGKR